MVEPRRLRLRASPLRRRRPTKPQLAALLLVTVLSFGPIVALITVVSQDRGPVNSLSTGRTPPSDGARITVTFTAVSPTTGTMSALVQVTPAPGLVDDQGPTADLVMQVNDARGDTSVVFPAGEPVRAVGVTLPLAGRSIVQYPFDRYRSAILLRLDRRRDDGGSGGSPATGAEDVPVRFTVDVASQLGDYVATLDDFVDGNDRAVPAVGVGFELHRAASTTVYAVGVMVLMWGLALAGVALLWAITIRGVEVPPWSVGYFVGVLFALPPLRASLPGSPPPGTLLDFVAFYWCVALVGVTLIVVLGVWLQRTRPLRPAGARDDDREHAEK